MNSFQPTRREVLRAGAAFGLVPALGAHEEVWGAKDRYVVCLQLHGGNDGLNTVAPVDDDRYQRARPDLALRPGQGHAHDDHHRWHPSLGRTARRYANADAQSQLVERYFSSGRRTERYEVEARRVGKAQKRRGCFVLKVPM